MLLFEVIGIGVVVILAIIGLMQIICHFLEK